MGFQLQKKIVSNVFSLYLVQLISIIIPLIEVIILSKSLGPEFYGEIVFYQSIALSCSIFVEYGFNINATKQVSVSINDINEISRIFYKVLWSKTVLSLPVLFFLVAFFIYSNVSLSLSVFTLLYFLAFSFSSAWFFQGKEKMVFVSFLDIFLRGIGLLLLWLLVSSRDDYICALVVMSIFPFLNTLITFFICRSEIVWVSEGLKTTLEYIKEGFHFFIFKSASSLSLSAVPIIIGGVISKEAVGLFVPVEKIIKGFVGLINPLLMGFFPYFSREISKSREFLINSILVLLVILGLSCLGVMLTKQSEFFILSMILKKIPTFDVPLFNLFIYIVPVKVVLQGFMYLIMFPLNLSKEASNLTLIHSLFTILSVLIGSSLFGLEGVVWSLLILDSILLMSCILTTCFKRG